jgi:Cytochrome bd terminal oxidase subunit I
MDITGLLLSRLQLAFTVSFHIIFPSFTIGLAAWITVRESLRLATGRPRDAVTFDGLAAMFDQIACRFRRAEMRLARLQSSTLPPSQPHGKAQ